MRSLRRKGMPGATLAAVGLVLCLAFAAQAVVVQTPLDPRKVPIFSQPLPVLGNGIPVVDGISGPVTLSICEFKTTVLPPGTLGVGTPAPATSVWGYRVGAVCPAPGTVVPESYIAPVIIAQKGTPTEVTFINQLGLASTTSVLAYGQSTDQTLMWADPMGTGGVETNACASALEQGLPLPVSCLSNYGGPIPAAVHLHGGEIPAMLDGGPDAWWTAASATPLYGHGYYSKGGVADAALGKAVYTYPNAQEASPIWFHDHVLGATRNNVYAGIAGAYMITDPALTLAAGLTPLGLGNGAAAPGTIAPTQELLIPVVIQDRMWDTTGQLLFPNAGINPTVHPFWIPEFIGDTIAVNGKVWPFLNVEPKRYRFLFLNGSNARTYELYLVNPLTGVKGPAMWVIGNDQGYLDKPVKITPTAKTNSKLVIMPGERYEVIVDFGGLAAGTKIEIYNTARAPYPAGVQVNGRTTGRILQFRVGACTSGFCGATDPSYNPVTLAALTGTPLVRLTDPVAGTVPANVTVHKTRRLTLNENLGLGGPLEILVNNTKYVGNLNPAGAAPRPDFTPITTQWNTTWYSELPHEGETELWEIVNLTADAHPVHTHLFGFQIVNRQPFDQLAYTAAYDALFPGNATYLAGVWMPGFGPPLPYNCTPGAPAPGRGVLAPATCVLGGNPAPVFLGPARPPLATEAGWKDTAISYPGEVLRILARFAPKSAPATSAADSLWYDFNPNGGHGYVWHCHIIDHEDNEMMRPFSVVSNPAGVRTFVQGPLPGQF